MRTKGDGRFAWGAICLVLFLALGIGEAAGATYYVATNGSDSNNGSAASPWATFAKAMSVLMAGDTLIIKNGTYNQSLNVTVSGTSGNPITIKAENDGQVIVDGQGLRDPLKIGGRSYIDVEGIVFRNAVYDVVKVSANSSYINLRRLSAYNAGVGNYHLFLIWNSNYVLVEDCIASQGAGTNKAGRYCYIVHNGAHHVTFRRNYCKYFNHTGGGGPCTAFSAYGANDNLFENNVADLTEMGTSCSGERYGLNIPAMYSNTDNNRFYGNVLFSRPTNPPVNQIASFGFGDRAQTGTEFIDNVFLNFGYALQQDQSLNTTYRNNTFVNVTTPNQPMLYIYNTSSAVVKNNSFHTASRGINLQFGSSITNAYNNLYSIGAEYYGSASQGMGDIFVDPVYDTVTYGKGAYLMPPSALQGQGEGGADIGAEVLYRYKDGVLTNEPLWPWPMEGRIFDETGISVTWESNGGLWKTLNGVYVNAPVPEPSPQPSDTTPPSTPNGIAASAVSSTQINLSWTASTDNVGVAGYKVYRNGAQVVSVPGTSYSDIGLTPSTTYTYKVSAYDAAGNNSPQSGSVSATTQGTAQVQSPYPGPNPVSVPGIIEAENFDNGGEGVSYHDVTPNNEGGAYRQTGVDIEACSEGGYNVGWIRAGEWLEYTINVPAAGTYDIEARVAAASGAGGNFHIEFNGVNKTGTMTISRTGGWQNWTTIKKSGVSLSAGQQVMRIFVDSQKGYGFNLNRIKITASTAVIGGGAFVGKSR